MVDNKILTVSFPIKLLGLQNTSQYLCFDSFEINLQVTQNQKIHFYIPVEGYTFLELSVYSGQNGDIPL